MRVAEGWTPDGWRYEIEWSKLDGKFRVLFVNERKEIWLLEDVKVVRGNGGGVVYVKGKTVALHPTSLEKAVVSFGEKLAEDLEEHGSAVIRPKPVVKEEKVILKVPKYGRVTLLFGTVLPRRHAAVRREVERELFALELARWKEELKKREEVRVEKPVRKKRVRKLKPTPVRVGLGKGELSRLKALFLSTLEGLGVKVTGALKSKGLHVVYMLERRFKGLPREKAYEEAVFQLLDWIERNVYSVPKGKERQARSYWENYAKAVLAGDLERAEETLRKLRRLAG